MCLAFISVRVFTICWTNFSVSNFISPTFFSFTVDKPVNNVERWVKLCYFINDFCLEREWLWRYFPSSLFLTWKKKFPGFKSNTEHKKIVSFSVHYSKRASNVYLNCVGFIISYSLQLASFETPPPPTSLLSQPRISKKNKSWLTTHSYLQNMLSQPSLTKWKSETGDWETEFSKGFK